MIQDDDGWSPSRRTLIRSAAVAVAGSQVLHAGSAAGSVADITWMPGWELRALIADKVVSPVEVTRHFLDRIDLMNPHIHAYVTVDHEGALAQARAAEKAVMEGEELGLLHGLPISVKDLFLTRGVRSTDGSLVYGDRIPQVDDLLVERLRAAGAVILGKTQTSEFGTFSRTKTLLAEETVNPWNTARIPGASSGGSGAAVAAGMSCLSVGSDGGGSTRIPACYNGVFGLHPSAGRIPVRIPRSVVMSSAGPITLHVRDAAIMLRVMAGPDPRDPSAIEQPAPDFVGSLDKRVNGLRIAWSRDLGCVPIVDARVVDRIEKMARRFAEVGAVVESPHLTLPDEMAWNVFGVLNEASYRRTGRLFDFSRQEQELLTPPTRSRLHSKLPPITADVLMRALEDRASVQHWADGIFADHDLVCTPTLGIVAPPIPDGAWDQPYEDPHYAARISTPYTYLANTLGLPAASVPCGFVDGLPVGLQIIGPRFHDVRVLHAAEALSVMQPWTMTHPPTVAIGDNGKMT